MHINRYHSTASINRYHGTLHAHKAVRDTAKRVASLMTASHTVTVLPVGVEFGFLFRRVAAATVSLSAYAAPPDRDPRTFAVRLGVGGWRLAVGG